MAEFIKTNPHKADAKIKINTNLMVVCITLFGIIWAFTPERLSFPILLQFVLAVPLLYISSIAYAKIAYWKEVKFWDYLGWFTGTTATAFVLNIIGILTFLLGYSGLALLYFGVLWGCLLIYTLVNIHYNPKAIGFKIFKLLFFVIIQLIFGIGVIYF